MIGNDVVDLCDPEVDPAGLHPRFDAFVFSNDEREQLDASADPRRLRWVLWAAKEATYKLARKRNSTAVFAPARFCVALDSSTVHHGGDCYRVSIDEQPSFVHAVATVATSAAPPRLARVAPLPPDADPGDAVRAFALQGLAPLFGTADLSIRREHRIPVLVRGAHPLPCDLSLSHHGRYVAFACELREEGCAA